MASEIKKPVLDAEITRPDKSKELKEAEDKLAKAKADAEAANKTYEEEIFKKYGFLLLSDMWYDKVHYPAGSRCKLETLSAQQIQRLLNEKHISK